MFSSDIYKNNIDCNNNNINLAITNLNELYSLFVVDVNISTDCDYGGYDNVDLICKIKLDRFLEFSDLERQFNHETKHKIRTVEENHDKVLKMKEIENLANSNELIKDKWEELQVLIAMYK